MTYEVCALKHPTILHFAKQEKSIAEENTVGDKTNETTVSSALVSMEHETCGYTGAGDAECILAIVPVRIKSRRSCKEVETYAFIDPGSSATFCSEALMNQLNMRGRKTEILLRTMGQVKVMQSYVLSGLEVCGLEEKDVVELPNVFTQNSIPVRRENIPLQKDIESWSYLQGHGTMESDSQSERWSLCSKDGTRLDYQWSIVKRS